MKRSKQLIILLLLLLSIFSCKKDDLTLTKETLSAKWNNSEAGIYESFEFNESGNYIIVRNDSTAKGYVKIILFGTYEIIDKTVVLSDFGTLTVSSLGNSSIGFSYALDTNPAYILPYTGTRQTEISTSTKTAMLCKTWEMYTVNGKQVVGTNYDLTILFSKAGSYFVSFVNPLTESDGGLSQWTWKDTTELKICYSWTGVPTCSGNNEIDITDLTDTSLTITENNAIYVLHPALNTKSALCKPPFVVTDIKSKNSFFNH
jgi:hypothetical protein